MNYSRHYDALIARARTRTLTGYSERHHVVPKCLGGSNARENIVRLTPEEHYVAHQLLVKMHPGEDRLLWAAIRMAGRKGSHGRLQRSNKTYGWLRKKFAAMRKGRRMSQASKEKLSANRRGKGTGPRSAEIRARMSAAQKGRKLSPEKCAAMSAVRMGKRRAPHTEETKAKMSVALKGRPVSRAPQPEQQRESLREMWRRRKAGLAPMPAPLGARPAMAACHADRPHYGRGMCKRCCNAERRTLIRDNAWPHTRAEVA